MQNVFTAERTKLLDLYSIRMFFLVLRSAVINTTAFGALKLDGFTHYINIILYFVKKYFFFIYSRNCLYVNFAES